MNKVVVIGAGAAGLVAAGSAAREGAKVLLIEKNERPGRKLMITGKGRCNVTNNCALINDLIENTPTNGRFLFSAFSQFMPIDMMELLESNGVELKVERGNRVFPVSDKAADVVDALVAYARNAGVEFVCDCVTAVECENDEVKCVIGKSGHVYDCDRIIVATGGLSYPRTGSTGDGYEFARETGHTVVEPKPSLVPLECHEGFCSELQGLSLRNVAVTVRDTETYREVYRDFGELLFTHFGVSGPVVLSASAHFKNMKPKKYVIEIDLKPALTDETLDKRIQRDFAEFSNRNFINALDGLLPKKLVPVVVRLCGVKPSLKTNQVTREMRLRLVSVLKCMSLTVIGFRPIEEAVVTSGGVSVAQLNPKTMESKLVKGLYFAGEVVDVDAYTGGFNLQIAFSTGRLAGLSSAK